MRTASGGVPCIDSEAQYELAEQAAGMPAMARHLLEGEAAVSEGAPCSPPEKRRT